MEGKKVSEAKPNEFSGFLDVKTEATGFYRVECFAGRWLLVTPEGHPIWSLGINHLKEQVGPVWFYDTSWWREAGENPNRAVDNVLNSMLDLGFNSAGCYDNVGFFVEKMPFVATLFFPSDGIPNEFNYSFDIFDPTVQTQFSECIEQQCAALKDTPNLIGYIFPAQSRYHTGCISPDEKFSYNRADRYRQMASDAPGKERYVAFLKERYGDDIQRLNTAYQQCVGSFDELLAHDFSALDKTAPCVQEDDAEFMGVVAETLYSVLHQAVKKVDDQRLIFSEKFALHCTPDSVIQAAGRYVDVVCAIAIRYLYWMLKIEREDWRVYPETMGHWHALSGKPILMGDWVGPVDEAADGEAHQWLMQAAKSDYLIGVDRCRLLKDISAVEGNASVPEWIKRTNLLATDYVHQNVLARMNGGIHHA